MDTLADDDNEDSAEKSKRERERECEDEVVLTYSKVNNPITF